MARQCWNISKNNMNVALVCIAKNEDNYIQEWINYNLKLGFDHIFIYANDWQYHNDQKEVTIIPFNGRIKQFASYNHFKINLAYNFSWVAFFDIDEFLVLKNHKNIKDFLNNYNDLSAIGINWALFGNNGHESIINNEYSVLKRFTKRSKIDFDKNNHVKSIVKLPSTTFQDIHTHHAPWYNLNREIRNGSFNDQIDWSVAQLNHYFTKSTNEFKIKCFRGRADNPSIRKFEEHEYYLHLNDEDDFLARDFLYENM